MAEGPLKDAEAPLAPPLTGGPLGTRLLREAASLLERAAQAAEADEAAASAERARAAALAAELELVVATGKSREATLAAELAAEREARARLAAELAELKARIAEEAAAGAASAPTTSAASAPAAAMSARPSSAPDAAASIEALSAENARLLARTQQYCALIEKQQKRIKEDENRLRMFGAKASKAQVAVDGPSKRRRLSGGKGTPVRRASSGNGESPMNKKRPLEDPNLVGCEVAPGHAKVPSRPGDKHVSPNLRRTQSAPLAIGKLGEGADAEVEQNPSNTLQDLDGVPGLRIYELRPKGSAGAPAAVSPNAGAAKCTAAPLQSSGPSSPDAPPVPAPPAAHAVPFRAVRAEGRVAALANEGEKGAPCRCVVRDKASRQRLQGFDCEHCRSFYNATGGCGPAPSGAPQVARLASKASRHRFEHPPVSTPPGFWDLSFPHDNGQAHGGA